MTKRPGALAFSMAATIPGGYGQGTARDNYAIDMRGDRDQQWIMLEGAALVGPYTIEKDMHHVIVPGPPEGMVVNMEKMTVALQGRLEGVVTKSKPPADEDDPDKVLLLVGTALMKAFTLGLAAVGAPTEFAAGMSDVLGDLVSSGISAPPPASQIAEIKAAVKDVLEEASAKKSG